MSSVVISGDTSGAITLSAPAVAGTNTLTLPATTATIATLTTPSFASTIGVGGATASASGAGITFPATSSVSSSSNTLDDYERGTWTPADASGAGLSFTVNSAFYVKIGRLVFIQSYTNMPSTASAATITIGGLPFLVTSDAYANIQIRFSGIATLCLGQAQSNNTTLTAYSGGTASPTNVNNSNGYFVLSGTYYTSV